MNTAIIVALIGGAAGIITAIASLVFKVLDYRAQQREKGITEEIKKALAPVNQKLDAIIKRQDKLESQLEEQAVEIREVRGDTTRNLFSIFLQHQPHNHDTILKIAERYFLVLGEDWVMTEEFLNWAEAEKVPVPNAILEAIERNHVAKK